MSDQPNKPQRPAKDQPNTKAGVIQNFLNRLLRIAMRALRQFRAAP